MSAPELPARDAGEAPSASSDTVAGFLATFAIFVGIIGIVWHPLRLIPAAMVSALLAAAMGANRRRLGLTAVLVAAACFFFGMAVAVIFQKPLW